MAIAKYIKSHILTKFSSLKENCHSANNEINYNFSHFSQKNYYKSDEKTLNNRSRLHLSALMTESVDLNSEMYSYYQYCNCVCMDVAH